jgi:MarR family transcriptional regulator for hemolysin
MATTAAPQSIAVDLAFLLDQASHALTQELAGALADLDITPRLWCVLSKAAGNDYTQNRLAEVCALDKTTMVVAIDELERAGFAERRLSATDRRARVIVVTEAGRRVVAEASQVVGGVYTDVLSTLPARERDALVGGLVRLVEGRLSTPVYPGPPIRRRAARNL